MPYPPANSIESSANYREPSVPASLQRATADFILVGSFTGLVKLVGAVKSAVSVRAFGISHALDCYLVAFALVSLICEVLAGSLTPALVPAIVRVRTLKGSKASHFGYGTILYSAIIALSGAGLVTVTLDRFIFRVLASGFSQPDLELTHELFLIMFPLFPLTAVTAVWRALLNSESRFALAAITPVMTPLAATLFLFAASTFGGIYALALGSAAGALGEVILLAIGLSRSGIAIVPRCGKLLDFRPWLLSDYLPMLTSSLVGGSRPAVDQAFAATLSPGSVSTLNLGTRVVTLLTTLGPTTASTVFLPKLSLLTATNQWRTLRTVVRRSLVLGSGAACVIAALGILFSHPLAYLAFEKGAAHPLDIGLLTNVQSVSFLQLPFAFASAILIRVIVSARLNRQLLFVSVFAFVVNLLLDLWFVQYFRVSGIVLATAAVQALVCVTLILAMRRLPRRDAN